MLGDGEQALIAVVALTWVVGIVLQALRRPAARWVIAAAAVLFILLGVILRISVGRPG